MTGEGSADAAAPPAVSTPRPLQKAILGTAAALTLSNVLWTVVMIMPVNTKLKTIKDAKASGKATAEGPWAVPLLAECAQVSHRPLAGHSHSQHSGRRD